MNIGLTVLIALYLADIMLNTIRHGESKKPSTYDGWSSLFAAAIQLGFMYWAGLFDSIG